MQNFVRGGDKDFLLPKCFQKPGIEIFEVGDHEDYGVQVRFAFEKNGLAEGDRGVVADIVTAVQGNLQLLFSLWQGEPDHEVG